jgi:hypothetical protein
MKRMNRFICSLSGAKKVAAHSAYWITLTEINQQSLHCVAATADVAVITNKLGNTHTVSSYAQRIPAINPKSPLLLSSLLLVLSPTAYAARPAAITVFTNGFKQRSHRFPLQHAHSRNKS